MQKVIKHIHFMGIGGSACSGIALIAQSQGYRVSGCDLEKETSYINKVKDKGIKVKLGHSDDHIKDADLLVVSPAILYQNPNHPEVSEARKRNILFTWEEFLGRILQQNKEVICIAGTHGKSTTTAVSGLVFEKAGMEPNVILGAEVKEWQANYRVGKSGIFITEADEFNDNFLTYSPSVVLLNNIEFDHPDYFKSYAQILDSFAQLLQRLGSRKTVIVNQDDKGIKGLLRKLGRKRLESLNIFGYTFSDTPILEVKNSVRLDVKKVSTKGTEFSVKLMNHPSHSYYLGIPGIFNVANMAGVIILSKIYNIEDGIVAEVLKNFAGIERRLEFIGEKKGIKVFDDYAHHPTAIRATLTALRQKYPVNFIWAVDEPHSYSRTKALLKDYRGVFDQADRVIIAPIFKARDKDTFGLKADDLVKNSNHRKILYLDSFEKICDLISREAKKDDIILVMGAGKSYLLTQKILLNI